MKPLNPFLSAFFSSPVQSNCTPVHHHVLLVPLTDVLLTSRDTESGAALSEVVTSEDFLSSHVLRIPNPGGAGAAKEATQNLREVRGKARQFSTINGKSVIIKDSFIYSNKGFKSLVQAQLLNDSVWYPDVLEPRQWLLYYISKPLVGSWEEEQITPALLVPNVRAKEAAEKAKSSHGNSSENAPPPPKKDVKNFHDLLNQFPMIARQMQPGLEKLFLEFNTVFQKPLPPPPSAHEIPDPQPDGPIAIAMRKARSNSLSGRPGEAAVHRLSVEEDFYAEDDEDVMRASLESAVTSAIDLFQGVDKQQLSLLGATTDLTGPLVEKLIERYVAENVHHLLFPRLIALKRPEDQDLEVKIRQMEYIDISQLGIVIEGGSRAKHALIVQLDPAIEGFRRISTALSPQEVMDLLLSTVKKVSQLTDLSKAPDLNNEVTTEKESFMTVNADTLVSLLLYVVIRSQVRHLHARLAYLRSFIFIDDVDSGELGYALSTFEAVLTYLLLDSAGLRRASRKNKALWDSARTGDVDKLRCIMEPSSAAIEDDEDAAAESPDGDRRGPPSWSLLNGTSRRASLGLSMPDRFSHGSGLDHVFPFQANGDADPHVDELPFTIKNLKKVSMDTRSMSTGSEISFHSRTASVGTISSALEGDISVERISQTNDSFGESVLMMAVQNDQVAALKYLLSLPGYFPVSFVLEDMNNEDTSLLSAAVQLGRPEIIDAILSFVSSAVDRAELAKYMSLQDIWGRSVGHYLFHAPFLIARLEAGLISWRQRDKNGQTPLFALCRSYDHARYYDMVEAGLNAAREAQQDGEPLHIDEHVDGKGNTILHIINDARLALRILQDCDLDVNATNDKRLTALMVASKYGRYDMVRCLYADPRVDIAAKEVRGLTAVELAKDEEVRNKIDDLSLFSMAPGRDGWITGVVRAFFVEDGSVRLVLKSASPTDHDSYTVTTSRRTLDDFENLARLLETENPTSWIPTLNDMRSPFQIATRPSRAILRDLQARTDWFLKMMLSHPTLATHEMLWEFFLVPELRLDAMEQRTQLKVAAKTETINDEYEPIEDVREVEQFVSHAREMVRGVSHLTKSVTRRAYGVGLAASDMYDSSVLTHRAVSALRYLPATHVVGFEAYVRALMPAQSSAQKVLHTTFMAVQSSVQAVLSSLSRPSVLIGQIAAAKREAERHSNSVGRSSRWPLGLLDDTRQRLSDEREEKARRSREEALHLAKELRFTQQTVASELAGWQSLHEKMGRRAIRDFARGMLVQERLKLEGMKRALRKVRGGGADTVSTIQKRQVTNAELLGMDEVSGGGELV